MCPFCGETRNCCGEMLAEEINEMRHEVDRLRTAQTIKPHQIRELVNQLRDIAIKHHNHDSLRDRLSRPVMTLWRISDEQQREEPL